MNAVANAMALMIMERKLLMEELVQLVKHRHGLILVLAAKLVVEVNFCEDAMPLAVPRAKAIVMDTQITAALLAIRKPVHSLKLMVVGAAGARVPKLAVVEFNIGHALIQLQRMAEQIVLV